MARIVQELFLITCFTTFHLSGDNSRDRHIKGSDRVRENALGLLVARSPKSPPVRRQASLGVARAVEIKLLVNTYCHNIN